MPRVLIVGDAPSRLNHIENVAFIGAACYPRLIEWVAALKLDDYELVNSDTDACMDFISKWSGDAIIALGRKAQSRLRKAGISYIALPHPSGRNRQLNNRWWLLNQLVDARNQLKLINS